MPVLFRKKIVSLHTATSLISGFTTKNGAPISCPVRAYNRDTGELLSKTISKSDGSYVLFGSRLNPNYVMAVDPLNEYNLAAQDNVK